MSLERFIEAQARIWPAPLEEVRAGRKTSHWMWFVFPQLKGLGRSPMAQHYAINDLPEARAYLAHRVLGPRLDEISSAMLAHRGAAVQTIMGTVDAVKLRSSMTLFQAAGGGPVFPQVLDAFYAGNRCEATLELLGVESE